MTDEQTEDALDLLRLWLAAHDASLTICRCNCAENEPAKAEARRRFAAFEKRARQMMAGHVGTPSTSVPGMFRDLGRECARIIMEELQR